MKKKIWLTPEQAEEIHEDYLKYLHDSECEIILGPYPGFTLEIDLPDEPERSKGTPINYQPFPLTELAELRELAKKLEEYQDYLDKTTVENRCRIIRIGKRINKIEKRLDSIDKLDELAGLNLRMNNVESYTNEIIGKLAEFECRLDYMQSESKKRNGEWRLCDEHGFYHPRHEECPDCREKQKSEIQWYSPCIKCGNIVKFNDDGSCPNCIKQAEEKQESESKERGFDVKVHFNNLQSKNNNHIKTICGIKFVIAMARASWTTDWDLVTCKRCLKLKGKAK